jgi:hypothetical protein
MTLLIHSQSYTDNKIKVEGRCGGVTAVKDKIYIGGFNQVIILNTDGSRVREITTYGMSFESYPLMHA